MPKRTPEETLADTSQDILRERVGLLGRSAGNGVDALTVQEGSKFNQFLAHIKKRMDEHAARIAPHAPPSARSFVPEDLYRSICKVSLTYLVVFPYRDTDAKYFRAHSLVPYSHTNISNRKSPALIFSRPGREIYWHGRRPRATSSRPRISALLPTGER